MKRSARVAPSRSAFEDFASRLNGHARIGLRLGVIRTGSSSTSFGPSYSGWYMTTIGLLHRGQGRVWPSNCIGALIREPHWEHWQRIIVTDPSPSAGAAAGWVGTALPTRSSRWSMENGFLM